MKFLKHKQVFTPTLLKEAYVKALCRRAFIKMSSEHNFVWIDPNDRRGMSTPLDEKYCK